MLRTRSTTLAGVALFLACSVAAAGQVAQGAVSGAVMDPSGGLLPGVTVTATAADGRVLAMSVTDHAGEYVFPALPAARTTLSFELGGFTGQVTTLVVQPGVESQVVERLNLAALAETVDVVGLVPADPPPPSTPLRRPTPVVTPVPALNRDAICGPAKASGLPESLGTIASGRDHTEDRLYTTGSEVVVLGGLDRGLAVGRNLVARRRYRMPGSGTADATREHSAGLLQIVEVGEHASVAVVVYACDELRRGDFLVAFQAEPVHGQGITDAPGYHDPAPILFADEGQSLGSPRRLMVMGRGSEQGAFVGQRVTLFRQRPSAAQRIIVGDAVVVAVRADSATIRIDRVTDAIAAGDWAAPEGPPVN